MSSDAELGAELTAFVISPIGDKLAATGTEERARYEEGVQMWENVFQPACAVFGLESVRADKIAAPGEIPDQIFLLLRDADVVIADLSGANPNVMYELGLRHSRDKITVQVGEHGRLPFDINTVRTIQFRRTEAGLIDLRDSVTDSLRAGLKGEGSPTSATRVWNDAAPVDEAVLAEAARNSALPDDPAEEVEEPGIIEMLADGESGLNDIAEALGDATIAMQEIGSVTGEASARIKASDAAGKGFAGRLLVTRQLSADLAKPLTEYDTAVERYYESLTRASVMIEYLLNRLTEDPDQAVEQGPAFLANIESLVSAAEESETHVASYARGVAEWKRLSKDLREPAKIIERASHRIMEGIGKMSAWRPQIEEAREALKVASSD